MKRKFLGILISFLFLMGLGMIAYPTISDQWNTYRQSRLISSYESTVQEMTPEDFTQEWEAARQFNSTLAQNNIYGDVFSTDEEDLKNTEYWKVLNIGGDGVMGYLSVPKINVKISIYHGTGDEVLQTGAGHLDGTGLPIGGENTHSVLAAHRGLPSARLFTDIDQLHKGDRFYIHVLDETLAYEVDQITDMVDKDDMETLEEALQVVPGRGSCNAVYLHPLRSEFPPSSGARYPRSVRGRGRNRKYPGGYDAAGGTELLHAVFDFGIVGNTACDTDYEVPVRKEKKI
ncbi:MAG: class C sortase [Lacrimispora saccharolytica]